MNKKFAVSLLFLMVALLSVPAFAQEFSHIIIIVQENRTVDNIFQDPNLISEGADILPGADLSNPGTAYCSIPDSNQELQPWAHLNACFDPYHFHETFNTTWDGGAWDGACNITIQDAGCYSGSGVANYTYVPNYYISGDSGSKILDPYFQLAETYGFANYMFQTNQGTSYVAHQFLFSGTSAPEAYNTNDSDGNQYDYRWYADDNPYLEYTDNNNLATDVGCYAPWGISYEDNIYYTLEDDIDSSSGSQGFYYSPESEYAGFTCYSHPSLANLLDSASLSWKYYIQDSSYDTSIWTAPNSLTAICPFDPNGSGCESSGPTDWAYVDDTVGDILNDIHSCSLPQVSWVIPDGHWSDHPGGTGFGDGGPSWVAAIANAIGGANDYKCTEDDENPYWSGSEPTLILVTWDDWGGWFDHVQPYLSLPTQEGLEGGYPNPPETAQYDGDWDVYGFRVPLLVVSAYANQGYVSGSIADGPNKQPPYIHDFGSILGFIEYTYGLPPYDIYSANICGIEGVVDSYCYYPYADYFAPDSYVSDNCSEGTCPYPLSDFFGDSTNSFVQINGAKYPPDCFTSPSDMGCFGSAYPEDPDDDGIDLQD